MIIWINLWRFLKFGIIFLLLPKSIIPILPITFQNFLNGYFLSESRFYGKFSLKILLLFRSNVQIFHNLLDHKSFFPNIQNLPSFFLCCPLDSGKFFQFKYTWIQIVPKELIFELKYGHIVWKNNITESTSLEYIEKSIVLCTSQNVADIVVSFQWMQV